MTKYRLNTHYRRVAFPPTQRLITPLHGHSWRVAGTKPAVLTGYDWSQISDEHFRVALDQRLSPDLLREWVGADADRMQSVLGAVTDVTGLSAAIRGREHEVLEAVVALFQEGVWEALEAAGAEINLRRSRSTRRGRLDKLPQTSKDLSYVSELFS